MSKKTILSEIGEFMGFLSLSHPLSLHRLLEEFNKASKAKGERKKKNISTRVASARIIVSPWLITSYNYIYITL